MSEVKNVNDSSAKKARKSKKVKEGPIRAKSGYLMFCVDKRPIVVTENPSITNTDIVTELAKRWQQVKTDGGDELQKYVELARVDKERYQQEKSQWDSNNVVVKEEDVVVVVVEAAPKKKTASKKTKKEPEPEPEPIVEEEILEEEEEVVVVEKKAKGKGKKK